jgi:excisionase family DNA binding protein
MLINIIKYAQKVQKYLILLILICIFKEKGNMMKNDIQYFNTEEVAKLLGVNISTIKRWTDAGKLKCTKTIGGHRKFYIPQIAEFLENNQIKSKDVQMFPVENSDDLELSSRILNKEYSFLIDYTLQQALTVNRTRLQQIINGLYLSQEPIYKIYDSLLTPVLRNIGSLWEKEIISVSEEHLASQAIKDSVIRLQVLIKLPHQKKGIVACLNLSHEMHDIALKMVDHVLECRGYKILNMGQDTPLQKIEQIFENYAPRRLYISSTFVPNPAVTRKEFLDICEIGQRFGTDIYIGGLGFDYFDYMHPVVVKRLYTFEEVYLT